MNHKQQGFCPLSSDRSAFVTSVACQEIFVARDFTEVAGVGTEEPAKDRFDVAGIFAFMAGLDLGIFHSMEIEPGI